MEKYRHMAFSASAAPHDGTSADGSYPIAMLFRLAGDEVVEMREFMWKHLNFRTDADATDYAAKKCREAIDVDECDGVSPANLFANNYFAASGEMAVAAPGPRCSMA